MMHAQYTMDQLAEARQLCATFGAVPVDKRAIAAVAAEAFINGMTAQERLSAPPKALRMPEGGPGGAACPAP